MDNVLEITRKLKGYAEITISNSAFEDLKDMSIDVNFSMRLVEFNGGFGFEFDELKSMKMSYEGAMAMSESGDAWQHVEESVTDFADWKVEYSTGTDEVHGLRLDAIDVDVINKEISLGFNYAG